jgi:hypothetical protein
VELSCSLYHSHSNGTGHSPAGKLLGQDEECPGHRALATIHALQERYCEPYISLPAIGMRAVRISPDSASVM